MKSKLKFVNAGLFFLSFACLFMNMITLGEWKFNALKVLKIGFSGGTDDGFLQEILYYIQQYIQKFAIMIIVIIAITLLGIIVCCFLSKQLPYALSIVLALVNIVCVMVMYIGIVTNIEDFDYILQFFGWGSWTGIKHVTFIVWMLVYALIMILSVVGLFVKDAKKVKKVKEEAIYMADNGSKAGMINFDKDDKKKDVVQSYPEFHGALVGESVIYKGKALPMVEKTKVFFVQDGSNIVTSKYEESDALAAVYYISEYQEYCVEVNEKLCVFLESGQPLGKGRGYYLPRGTKIYVKDAGNTFTLA